LASLGHPLLGVSHVALQGLMRFTGRVVGSAVDTEVFDPEKTDAERFFTRERIGKYGLKRHVPLLLYPARIEPQKGQKDLLSLAKDLKNQKIEAQIVLLGEVGSRSYLEDIQAAIRENGLQENFCFLPAVAPEEMPDAYAAATLVVAPTQMETFGLIAAEAAAMRIPFVGYDVGGLREVVESGRTGILVPLNDISRLSRVVIDLLADPSFREKLGRTGRLRIIERFSVPALAQRHLAIYHRATSKSLWALLKNAGLFRRLTILILMIGIVHGQGVKKDLALTAA